MLGNKTASGTAIIDELGAQHIATGDLILYTSADSVLQIAAHEEVVPLASSTGSAKSRERSRIVTRSAASSRVRSSARRARSGAPTTDATSRSCRPRRLCSTTSGTPASRSSASARSGTSSPAEGSAIRCTREGNNDGMHLTLEALATLDRGLLFVNLVDFDMVYGHRNDAAGYRARAREFDALAARAGGRPAPRRRRVHHRRSRQRPDDARHRPHPRAGAAAGVRPPVRPARLGTRASFCDLGQTIAEGLGVAPLARGESFLAALHGPA